MTPLTPLNTGPLLGTGGNGSVSLGYSPFGSPVGKKTNKNQHPHVFNHEVAMTEAMQGIPHAVGFRGKSVDILLLDALLEPTLYSLFKDKREFSFYECITIAKQGLEFLQETAYRGLIHGDIKLDNMFFSNNTLTFIDFGNSGRIQGLKPEDVRQGAPYRSPEVILHGPVDSGVDIWSFGCSLFEVITGENLFRVRFAPSPNDTHLSDNQHLHILQETFGPLPLSLLNQGKKTTEFFTINPDTCARYKRPLKPISTLVKDPSATYYLSTLPWRTRLIEALTRKNASQEQIDQMIQLLEQMFKYENRASAAELIKSPLFQEDIHFHFTKDLRQLPREHIIVLYRQSELRHPALMIHLAARVNRHCFHVQKDTGYFFQIYDQNHHRLYNQLITLTDCEKIDLQFNAALHSAITPEKENVPPTSSSPQSTGFLDTQADRTSTAGINKEPVSKKRSYVDSPVEEPRQVRQKFSPPTDILSTKRVLFPANDEVNLLGSNTLTWLEPEDFLTTKALEPIENQWSTSLRDEWLNMLAPRSISPSKT